MDIATVIDHLAFSRGQFCPANRLHWSANASRDPLDLLGQPAFCMGNPSEHLHHKSDG
jgi:hypothetical protein